MSNEKKNDGGPAYPMHVHIQSDNLDGLDEIYGADQEGMSLRDHFAGLAPPQEINTILVHQGLHNEVGASWIDVVTRARYVWADQMLKAREQ